uniref:DYW domain-containing protein n=1 Tax=Fagus sylvatica TaxID=28930 RepID=A0A2N9HES6_FAGSY
MNLLAEMELKNLRVGPQVYGELLQGCVYQRAFFTGQQIHAQIVKNGYFFAKNEYLETKLVIFYAKCDVSEVANSLFCKLRVQNVFSWAAIIGMHCKMGLSEEALLGFVEMQKNGFFPDNFVVPNALKACGALGWIGFGKGVHGYVVKTGFGGCVFVASSLVDMYGKCGVLEDARKVFDGMLERNAVTWNSMIVSYVQNGMSKEAVEVFYDMRVEGVEPTRVTVSSFLSASANIGALEEGKQGHAIAVIGGLELDNILGSSIINFYFKVGLIDYAELVFSRMLEKDVVTWNLLISGYAQFGQVDIALNMCRLMRSENLRFDSVTLASLLSASADISNMKLGKEGHCYCIRNNLESDVVVASSIVDMYAKCERIDYARQVFNSTIKRDIVLWNTMLAAYAELGQSGEALKLFYQMQLEGVPPNVISWNSVILGFLRSGQVSEAKDMFLQLRSLGVQPNRITWTTLISGLAQNGFPDEAILVFQQMQEAGITPNTISLVSALSACTDMAALHYGKAFHGYVTRHNIWLSIPIATSLVDMYAKCGIIDQANWVFDMILSKELPLYNAMICAYALHGRALEALAVLKQLEEEGIEPDNITFTSVLSACSHAGLVNEGLELFSHMVSKFHVKPTMEHYGCVVNLLSRCGNFDEALRLILTLPCKPDAHILGSLLAACRDCHEIELGDYLSKHLLKLEPDNPGNYVALSNAYAASGRWDEVSYMRNLMKQKGLRKVPGCSWVQIGGELHVFVAGDKSHPKTRDIYTTLALLGMEMQITGYVPMFNDTEILCS